MPKMMPPDFRPEWSPVSEEIVFHAAQEYLIQKLRQKPFEQARLLSLMPEQATVFFQSVAAISTGTT